jgi:hypothetical protein
MASISIFHKKVVPALAATRPMPALLQSGGTSEWILARNFLSEGLPY